MDPSETISANAQLFAEHVMQQSQGVFKCFWGELSFWNNMKRIKLHGEVHVPCESNTILYIKKYNFKKGGLQNTTESISKLFITHFVLVM
jgi:hypothetical protein